MAGKKVKVIKGNRGARPTRNTARASRLNSINGVAAPHPLISALKAVVLILCCAAVILPFVAIISTSLADPEQVRSAGGYVMWPQNPTLDAYAAILRGGIVSRALLVSVFLTVVGSGLSLVVVTLLAYGLSRPGTTGHRPALLLVLFSMLFAAGIIPNYLLIKELGLIDSIWALILPTLVSGFQVVLMRAFFLEVPKEILEAARIDGAGELKTLLRIVIPLSKASIAVIAFFNAVGYWNAYFNAVLYINDTAKWPLQLVLRAYVVDNSSMAIDVPLMAMPSQQSLQMAILVLALVPICVLYPFLQKHFKKGVIIGAVKG